MGKLLALLGVAVAVVPFTVVAGAGQVSATGGGVGLSIQPLVFVRQDPSDPEITGHPTATVVNASGQIVGTSPDADRDERPHGFLTDPTNTDVTRLDSIDAFDNGSDLTSASALNNAGLAVGASTIPLGDDAPPVAVVWDATGTATDLGTIGNRPCTLNDEHLFACDTSVATGINNTGTAVGGSDRDDGSGGRIHHAFADTLATLTMTDLGTLRGGTNSSASGVNDADIVVGSSETTDGGAGLTTHAFADNLAGHTMRDLGTLPGGTSSAATAVNAGGLVVGSSTVTGGANHPFAYNVARHKMKDLGLPPGATSAGATGVNDDGLVVGDSDAGPWVYEPISKTFTMIPGADTATGINDSGEIVGVGLVQDPLVPPPTVALVQGPYRTLIQPPTVVPGVGSVAEGNSGRTALQVPVTLANTSTKTVTVQWNTVFGAGGPVNQADPASDYTAASGTVTFAPGQTSKTVTIEVHGDTLVEPDEFIVVSFHDPTNATIGGYLGLGFGLIVNDD